MNIEYIESERLFKLDTPNCTYAMRLDDHGHLYPVYWGSKIILDQDLPTIGDVMVYFNSNEGQCPEMRQEYPVQGGYFFDEPALKVTFANGTRDTLTKYDSHIIEKSDYRTCLTITMKDINFPLAIRLVYQLYQDSDMIDKSCVIVNTGSEPFTLESVQSAAWYLPQRKQYRLTHLAGGWCKEYQVEQVMLTQAKTTLETRRGTSGPDANPVFFVDEGGQATEEQGRVWFGGVHWSGNWKIVLLKNRYNQLTITGGINDFDFAWHLAPGASFTSPVFSGGYTAKGFGDASRIFHEYQTAYLLPPQKAQMVQPVLLNAFGSFRENINEEKMLQLTDNVAKIGVELFVIDAGWHGYSDLNWQENIGDWEPHITRFPRGLKPLIEKVNALGMDFGIWLEPEMTHPKSHLFQQHPDWILRFDNRKGTCHSNRWILNLARQDVKDFVYRTIHQLLSEYNIKYFKIDNNRYITEMGWPEVDVQEQKGIWAKYVENFYEIFAKLNAEFPQVIFENCAAGGGRVDLAMSQYFSRINRSDNQDPLDVLKIHEGFSYAWLPKMAGGGCHISPFTTFVNNRTTPVRFQAHVGMLGSLAIGENLYECSQAKLDELKEYVSLYKDIRETVHLGQIYRLVSPRENPCAVFEYVSKQKDRAVLFVLGQFIQFKAVFPEIRLRGLNPDTIYQVEGYKSMSGRGLMEIGIPVKLRGDYDSRIIRIKASSIIEN